jgi:hypothetical protein
VATSSRVLSSRAVSYRIVLVALAAATVLLGLGVHRLPGTIGNVGGTFLYAVLVFLLTTAVRPSARWSMRATTALAICWAIELLQLTPWPAQLAEAVPPAAYVLGTTFTWVDMAGYAVGVGATVLAGLALASSFSAFTSRVYSQPRSPARSATARPRSSNVATSTATNPSTATAIHTTEPPH